jgi:hypothetical protein
MPAVLMWFQLGILTELELTSNDWFDCDACLILCHADSSLNSVSLLSAFLHGDLVNAVTVYSVTYSPVNYEIYGPLKLGSIIFKPPPFCSSLKGIVWDLSILFILYLTRQVC